MSPTKLSVFAALALSSIPPGSAYALCNQSTCNGDADSCQSDACELADEWTSALPLSSVKLSWHMPDGPWSHCSGVLVNDVAGSNALYVLTVGNCFDANLNNQLSTAEINAAQATLRTYFHRRTSPCGSATVISEFSRVGGVILEHSLPSEYHLVDDPSDYSPWPPPPDAPDFAFIRVPGSPPVGADIRFAGWELGAISSDSGLWLLHYPQGDSVKMAEPKYAYSNGPEYSYAQAWEEGGWEVGSSGAGLFTWDGKVNSIFWGWSDPLDVEPTIEEMCAEEEARTVFVSFQGIYPQISDYLGDAEELETREFVFCESGQGTLDYAIPSPEVLTLTTCDDVRLLPGFHAASGSTVRIAP